MRVRSRRSTQEKRPWKDLETVNGIVEKQFIRRVHLGSTVTPYRPLPPWLGVVPWDGKRLLHGDSPELAHYPGLEDWWEKVATLWNRYNKQGEAIDLADQVNYRHSLTNQFPIAPQRVVYAKSGTTLAACRISDAGAIIDHKLYWAAVQDAAEGNYLCAILNSDVLRDRVTPLQSRGLFGARDWDKYIFSVAFPIYDPGTELHTRIAAAGALAESVAAPVNLALDIDFKRARGVVRDALERNGIWAIIEGLVGELVS
jgi:hypothetical protein